MGKIKNVPFRVFCYVIVFLFLFIYLFPLFFVANTSLKSAQDYLLHPTALTSTWSFGNYITAWNKANFGAYIGNSILYTGVCTICSLLLSLLSWSAEGVYVELSVLSLSKISSSAFTRAGVSSSSAFTFSSSSVSGISSICTCSICCCDRRCTCCSFCSWVCISFIVFLLFSKPWGSKPS